MIQITLLNRHTLLYIKQITNKVLLYNKDYFAQYIVIPCNGK